VLLTVITYLTAVWYLMSARCGWRWKISNELIDAMESWQGGYL